MNELRRIHSQKKLENAAICIPELFLLIVGDNNFLTYAEVFRSSSMIVPS